MGADAPVLIARHAVPLHRVVAVEQPSQSAAGVPLHLLELALGTYRQERDACGYRPASLGDLSRVHFLPALPKGELTARLRYALYVKKCNAPLIDAAIGLWS